MSGRDLARFYAAARLSVFDGRLTADQVRGIDGILAGFDQVGDGRVDTLAYGLATAAHETGRRMVPVREGFAATDAEARRIVRARRYGQPVPPFGHVYYGRGLPQLTWARNYATSSADAGVDLVECPDAMLDPTISARVLFRGLIDGRWNAAGKGVAFYLDRPSPDLRNARRTVNVLDRWETVAELHRKFAAALELGGFATAEREILRPMPRPAPPADPGLAPGPADDLALDRLARDLAAWRAAAPLKAIAATTTWLQGIPK